MGQSRWMSVVDEKTTEIPEEIEETWIEVKRRTRTQETRQPEEDGKNRQMIQIFVKVYGSKTFPLMVSPSDKVDNVMGRISNSGKSSKSDLDMTCEGRVLRWSDELMGSRVDEGCTVQIMNMMRGGANHRNKRKKAENKLTASPKNEELVRGQQEQEHEEQKIIQSLISRENAEDAVIRHSEETEGSRKIIANLAEGHNSDMEQWMQI